MRRRSSRFLRAQGSRGEPSRGRGRPGSGARALTASPPPAAVACPLPPSACGAARPPLSAAGSLGAAAPSPGVGVGGVEQGPGAAGNPRPRPDCLRGRVTPKHASLPNQIEAWGCSPSGGTRRPPKCPGLNPAKSQQHKSQAQNWIYVLIVTMLKCTWEQKEGGDREGTDGCRSYS